MAMHIKNSGVWASVKSLHIRSSGVWKPVKEAWIRQSGIWVKFYTSLLATVSPGYVFGQAGSLTTGKVVTAYTNSCTATAVGGTSPFTYQWAKLSGDTFTVFSPTSQATTFGKTDTVPSTSIGDKNYSAVYVCTITDASGSQAQAQVTVQARIYNST